MTRKEIVSKLVAQAMALPETLHPTLEYLDAFTEARRRLSEEYIDRSKEDFYPLHSEMKAHLTAAGCSAVFSISSPDAGLSVYWSNSSNFGVVENYDRHRVTRMEAVVFSPLLVLPGWEVYPGAKVLKHKEWRGGWVCIDEYDPFLLKALDLHSKTLSEEEWKGLDLVMPELVYSGDANTFNQENNFGKDTLDLRLKICKGNIKDILHRRVH